MPLAFPEFWTDRLQQTLKRYDAALLRAVAGKLFKPRSQWPVEELVERSVATIANVAVLDRRLKDLEPAGRQLLALIGHSRQPRWHVGNLVEMMITLGHTDGLRPILGLLEAGLLYPEIASGIAKLRGFEQWLVHAGGSGPVVFAHPLVTTRAIGEDLGLPVLITHHSSLSTQEADGLEWPLRLAVLWQLLGGGPLRRTQQGEFFKRDWERLNEDGLLTVPLVDGLAPLPDIGMLSVALAKIEGILQEVENDFRAAVLPPCWETGLLSALESLWSALPLLECWEPRRGRRVALETSGPHPYPSAYLLSLVLLARLPDDAWADPALIEHWIEQHHPYWTMRAKIQRALDLSPRAQRAEDAIISSQDPALSNGRSGLAAFLLGVAYPLRLVRAVKNADRNWLVRLSHVGRWLLGIGPLPPSATRFPQTLLVQPNLEIVAYRQGLTPGLIASLSQVAAWKSIGAACTLQVRPETVYRALESGQTFETIRQMLERHAARELPAAVVDSLRTWSNKRERITVYPSGTLFEFATPEELNEALARGLPLTRLAGHWAVVAGESQIDFRHFRLTGTRDYGLPPEKCVEVGDDGVTLAVDLARSDLLVETEMLRFAELVSDANLNGRRQYRLTPASLTCARDSGLMLRGLDDWFVQRSGQPLSAAGRLLLTGGMLPAPEFRRQLVLHVNTAEIADGLVQWPATRRFIQSRLGPTALAVAEEHAEAFRQVLRSLGVAVPG